MKDRAAARNSPLVVWHHGTARRRPIFRGAAVTFSGAVASTGIGVEEPGRAGAGGHACALWPLSKAPKENLVMSSHVSMIQRESSRLVSTIDEHPVVGSVISGDASREEYVEFLRSTYHYIRWSGPLLAATAGGLRRTGRYPWLVEIVDEKTEEESPHDLWVLADLQTLGEAPERVKASPVPHAVQAYVHFCLALADEGSPAFLGAAYALELISARRARAASENLRARAKVPGIECALSFLDGHGDADPDHVAQMDAMLPRIEEPRDQAAIVLCAVVLAELYPRFFRTPGRA
jgi:hypothetical protein